MMKRSSLRCGLGAALASGVIYVFSLATPAVALEPSDAPSALGLDQVREGNFQDAEAGAHGSLAVVERYLWPPIEFSKEVPAARASVVELAQPTGPARLEYRLWPTTIPPAV